MQLYYYENVIGLSPAMASLDSSLFLWMCCRGGRSGGPGGPGPTHFSKNYYFRVRLGPPTFYSNHTKDSTNPCRPTHFLASSAAPVLVTFPSPYNHSCPCIRTSGFYTGASRGLVRTGATGAWHPQNFEMYILAPAKLLSFTR